MTKKEIHNKLTWTKEQMYRFRKELADPHEYDDYNSLFSLKETGFKYMNELKSRGLSNADRSRINAFLNEYFKAEKMMEKRLGY